MAASGRARGREGPGGGITVIALPAVARLGVALAVCGGLWLAVAWALGTPG